MKKFKTSLVVILLIVCCTVVFSKLPLDIKENSTIVDSDNKIIDNKKASTPKEVNVKLLDDSNLDSYNTDKYINLSEDEVNYLKENAQSLLKEFETGSMLDKYSLVNNMIKDYDTNIKMGDLISIAMSYLK